MCRICLTCTSWSLLSNNSTRRMSSLQRAAPQQWCRLLRFLLLHLQRCIVASFVFGCRRLSALPPPGNQAVTFGPSRFPVHVRTLLLHRTEQEQRQEPPHLSVHLLSGTVLDLLAPPSSLAVPTSSPRVLGLWRRTFAPPYQVFLGPYQLRPGFLPAQPLCLCISHQNTGPHS